MVSLFVFGTLWFWLLLAVAVIGIGAFIANERFGKATISVILFFTLLAFFGDFNLLKWLKAHAFEAALYAGAYFVAGTVWAVAKWWFFVRRLRERYDELKADFLRQHDIPGNVIPDYLKREWAQSMAHHASEFGLDTNYRRGSGGAVFPPMARNFKGKITSWMIYWPWSMIVTLIDDPIRKLFRGIYNAIQGALQRMSDKAFAGTESDFAAQTPPAVPPGGDASSHGNGSPPPRNPPPTRESRSGIDVE